MMDSAPTDGLRSSLRWVIPALLPLVVAAAFALAVLGKFQWDDYPLLVDNSAYRGLAWSNLRWMFSTNLMGHYMPVTWMTYGLDYILWGLDPFGYHLTNLVLHSANTTLVYVVALRLFRAVWVRSLVDGADSLRIGAAFTALLFGVHPLRVESVVWITERLDLVCGFFYLLAILMYLRGVAAESTDVRQSRRDYWAAVGMFVLALLSKSMAVTLPVVLLVLDAHPLRRLRPGVHGWVTPGPWRIWQEKVPFVLAGALVSVVAFRALLSFAPATSWDRLGLLERVAVSAYALAFYLWKTLLPVGLSPLYELLLPVRPFGWHFLLSGVVVLLITGVAFALRPRWPGLLAVWIGYGVMLFPVVGIFHKGHQIAADRYSYLPGIGWALLAGGAVVLALRRDRSARSGRRALAVILVFSTIPLLAFATWRQVKIWQDGVTLWRHAVRVDPASPIAAANLGWELRAQGDLAEAVEQCQRALLLRPDYADAHLNLGLARAAQGRAAEAERHLRRVLEITPRSTAAQSGLGSLLEAEGRVDEAIAHFHQALQISPRSAKAHNNLGVALARSGRTGEALAEFSEAVRLDPNFGQAQNNLGLALAHLGRLTEARDHFLAAIRSEPGFQDAQRNLAHTRDLLEK
jgi:tetratricopeptide (TPR) repeat protein